MRITLLALLASFAATHFAAAKTVNASMYGVDSDGCGATNAPCRTIGRAIQIAETGDTVMVGPGYYGDANRDGDLLDFEDEPANSQAACECIVLVNKDITLRSRDGASTTVIDARGITSVGVSFQSASGATLGGTNAGFTVRGAVTAGVQVGGFNMKRVRVIGNIADANPGAGFQVLGDDTSLTGNRAFDNGQFGFGLLGDDLDADGNVASGNGSHGFLVESAIDVRISKSVAVGNLLDGFHVESSDDVRIESVATLANAQNGALFLASDGRIVRSTIMGNGHAVDSNCGVNNQSGHEIDAWGNYWGSPNGPGPDPADDQCLGDGSPLDLDPVERDENEIKLTAVR